MAEKEFLVDINLLFNELKSARVENLAADPTTLYGGQFWFNTAAKALKYSDGTAVYQLAVGANVEAAIAAFKEYVDGQIATVAGNVTSGDAATLASAKAYADGLVGSLAGGFVGDFDASAGTIPTGTKKAGDYWRVSVAGTLSGLTPAENLEVGDMVVARVANPASAADFFSMQGNVSTAVTSGAVSTNSNELPVFSGATGKAITGSGILVSNLANTFSFSGVSLTAAASQEITLTSPDASAALKAAVQVFDGNGYEVMIGIKKIGKKIQLSANVAVTVSVVVVCPASVTAASVNPVT